VQKIEAVVAILSYGCLCPGSSVQNVTTMLQKITDNVSVEIDELRKLAERTPCQTDSAKNGQDCFLFAETDRALSWRRLRRRRLHD